MASLYTQQDSNIHRTWALMSLFFLVVIGVGWGVSYLYGAPELLWIAVVFSVGMNLISYWNADKIVLSLARAKKVVRDEHRELWNVVENLSITAGLPMPNVYIIQDHVPNAFATGRDKEHASVAVTSGLLEILDRTELEGVIAHELAHIGNRDILLQTVVVILVGFVTLLSDFFLRTLMFGGRGRDNKAGGIVAIIGIVLVILSPLIAILIQLAISRKREFLADASGALLTRYPEGLARALTKIQSFSGTMRTANHATAHLYIASPFGGKEAKGFLTKLFMTHPPVDKRIRALRGVDVQ